MIVLVDYENTHQSGMEGYWYLNSSDTLILYYSDLKSAMPRGCVETLREAHVDVKLVKLQAKRDNALDMYIAASTGIYAENHQKICIVSKDKGYQAVRDFWRMVRGTEILLGETIEQCLLHSLDTEDARIRRVRERHAKVNLVDEFQHMDLKNLLVKPMTSEALLSEPVEDVLTEQLELLEEQEAEQAEEKETENETDQNAGQDQGTADAQTNLSASARRRRRRRQRAERRQDGQADQQRADVPQEIFYAEAREAFPAAESELKEAFDRTYEDDEVYLDPKTLTPAVADTAQVSTDAELPYEADAYAEERAVDADGQTAEEVASASEQRAQNGQKNGKRRRNRSRNNRRRIAEGENLTQTEVVVMESAQISQGRDEMRDTPKHMQDEPYTANALRADASALESAQQEDAGILPQTEDGAASGSAQEEKKKAADDKKNAKKDSGKKKKANGKRSEKEDSGKASEKNVKKNAENTEKSGKPDAKKAKKDGQNGSASEKQSDVQEKAQNAGIGEELAAHSAEINSCIQSAATLHEYYLALSKLFGRIAGSQYYRETKKRFQQEKKNSSEG